MSVSPDAPLLPEQYISSGLSLGQLVAMVFAYRGWIVLTTLAFMVVTAIVSLMLPRQYDATATVLVDFAVNDPAAGREFPAHLAQSYMSTQVELMGSPNVLLPVVDRLGWATDPKMAAGYSGPPGGLRDWLASQVLGKSLSVSQSKDSRLIYVRFEAETAALAARVANTVAEAFVESSARLTAEPAQRRVVQYGEQLEELSRKLQEAQTKVTEFRTRTGVIEIEARADLETERLLELSRRVLEAENQSRLADLRLQQIGRLRAARGPLDSDAAMLASGVIQALKTQLGAIEGQLAQLSGTLGRNHPEFKALSAQAEAVRARFNAEVEVHVAAIKSQALVAAEVLTQLREELAAQRAQVLEAQRQQDDGVRYRRELETAKRVYDTALQGYDQLLLGSQSRYTNATVVSPASPPVKSSKPKRTLNVILAMFAGGFLGVTGSLLWELMHRRLRCREDAERDLGVPVLAEL